MLSVTFKSIMLSDVMLNAIMLYVVAPKATGDKGGILKTHNDDLKKNIKHKK